MGQVAAICESAYIGLTTAGELTDKPPGHNKRQDRRRSDTAHVINILAVGRIVQLVEHRQHKNPHGLRFESECGHKALERKGCPKAGAKQLRRLRCIVSLILYIHIIGEP